MPLYLITAPTDEVVTLEEAKRQLRISSDDNNEMIQAIINACVQQLDPAGGGWLGRALRPQTWELRLDGFPYDAMSSSPHHLYGVSLPYPPLILLTSLTYKNGDGDDVALTADVGYRVIGTASPGRRAFVAPIYNGTWPSSVRNDAEMLRIRYQSGYATAEGDNPDALPAPIKHAVLLMVKELWGLGERNLFVSSEDVPGLGSRSFVVTENASKVMRAAAENLLSTYRVWD